MDKIRLQMGFVIQVLDGLTGQSLEETGCKIQICLSKGKPPINKGEGYYLFPEPPEPDTLLVIEAAGYVRFEWLLSGSTSVGAAHKIYMEPDKNYPMSSRIYGISGVAEPKIPLLFVCQDASRQGRLIRDYEAGMEKIAFKLKGEVPEAGMEFQIRGQEYAEFLRLGNQMDAFKDGYPLEAPLSHAYAPTMSVIFPVKRVVTDAAGEFVCYWIRKKGERESFPCEVWTPEGERLETLKLQAGTIVTVGRTL